MLHGSNSAVGVYIHMPFCAHKCPYCDFYSLVASEAQKDAYLAALARSLAAQPFGLLRADTVYLGGGTPALFGPERTAQLLTSLAQAIPLTPGAEVTLEANPEGFTAQRAAAFRTAGVNRLSLGMQSADAAELSYLGRRHSAQCVTDAVRAAQEAGFNNISLDLIIGLPDQRMATLERSLEYAVGLNIQHLSCYMLKLEPGMPLSATAAAPDDDAQAELYLKACEWMGQHGFAQYEISNFALPGFESRHNTKYWNCDDVLALGPAAHGLMCGRRYSFPRDLTAFSAAADPWQLLNDEGEGGGAFEYLALRLRLREGLVFEDALKLYPDFPIDTLRQNAQKYTRHGLCELSGRGVALTPQGMLLENSLVLALWGD